MDKSVALALILLGLLANSDVRAEDWRESTEVSFVGSLTDPTTPIWYREPEISAKAEEPVHRLSSIIWSETRRSAIVNGKLVKEGDTLTGLQILAIYNDRVEARARSGRKLTLRLKRNAGCVQISR